MVSEEKAKELIKQLVYKFCDSLGYGQKVQGFGSVQYKVNGKMMTWSEYQDYCFKKELKKLTQKIITILKLVKKKSNLLSMNQKILKNQSMTV